MQKGDAFKYQADVIKKNSIYLESCKLLYCEDWTQSSYDTLQTIYLTLHNFSLKLCSATIELKHSALVCKKVKDSFKCYKGAYSCKENGYFICCLVLVFFVLQCLSSTVHVFYANEVKSFAKNRQTVPFYPVQKLIQTDKSWVTAIQFICQLGKQFEFSKLWIFL